MTNKTISINTTEAQYADIVNYANENGVSIEQAVTELATRALRAGKQMQGVITELSPEALEAIRQSQLQALKQHTEEAAPVPEAPAPTPAVDVNIISFAANDDVKELVQKINQTRAVKGLAPLEQSICEMLLHWGENMADYSSFEETTGLKYSWYKAKMIELAMAEREANGVKSNVVVPTGLFSKHSIVSVETASETV